jgi:S1-C subfamily serine protease
MSDLLLELSAALAEAIDRAAPSVVQVLGRRPAAGVVFDKDLVAAPSRVLDDDAAVVRTGTSDTVEATVLGHSSMGFAVLRATGLGSPPLERADEPSVGHVVLAIGRTWSGGIMATLTNVAVIGGPLRTGRASDIERVIRIAQAPHGALTGGALIDGRGRALGLVTGGSIRGTTIVIPGALAWSAAAHVVEHGGARQGYLGIGSASVALPERQRAGGPQSHGLLITAIVEGSPADAAGLLVGDVMISFDGRTIEDTDTLLTLLRGDRIGKPARLTLVRGGQLHDVVVTVGERSRGGSAEPPR